MTTINIKSVAIEHSGAEFKFIQRTPNGNWPMEFSCYTPSFNASFEVIIESEDLMRFYNDLTIVEKDRKGECQLFDEWNFSLTISSIDSVGHFVMRISIWSQGTWHKGDDDLKDTMNISFEIEPSDLLTLKENFNNLIAKES